MANELRDHMIKDIMAYNKYMPIEYLQNLTNNVLINFLHPLDLDFYTINFRKIRHEAGR